MEDIEIVETERGSGMSLLAVYLALEQQKQKGGRVAGDFKLGKYIYLDEEMITKELRKRLGKLERLKK